MATEKITKQDAAKRQLETAINLYFDDGDKVSIHTLAAAAFEVIRGVGKNKPIIEKINISISDLLRYAFMNETHRNALYKVMWASRKIYKKQTNEKGVLDFQNKMMRSFSDLTEDRLERLTDSALAHLEEVAKIPTDLDPLEEIADLWVEKNILKSEYKDQFFIVVRRAQNFFKHAIDDPEDSIEFDEYDSELLLYLATEYYMDVFEDYPRYMCAYQVWYKMRYPHFFVSIDDRMLIKMGGITGASKMSKSEYFSDFKRKN